MVDFRKVSKQVFEMAAGDGGRRFENQVPRLMKNIYPDRNFVQPSSQRVKTDLYEDKGTGDPRDNVNYSVKYTRDNGNPSKVHQVNHNPRFADNFPHGTFSKLKVPTQGFDDRDQFFRTLKDSKLHQAMVMRFGTNMKNNEGGNLDVGSFGEYFKKFTDGNRINDAQMNALQRAFKDKENPFLLAGEMAKNFPEHHKALTEHLDANKLDIFNNMVRRNGYYNPNFIDDAYDRVDPSNISRLIHRHVGEDYDQLNIRDASDEQVKKAVDQMNWYGKGSHTYLAPEKTDDWNKRLLDVMPWDHEASRWANNPSSTEFDQDERNWGARPGYMKATMGMDEEFVDQFFPKIWSGERRKGSDDNYLGDFILNNRKVESMDFNKLHFGETLEVEKSTSEKAMQSGQVQNDKRRLQRQKDQMAQKSRTAAKSDVVYASEEYFKELRHSVEHRKAQDSARYNWRDSIEEAAVEKPQDEGNHPYVDVMPHTHKINKKPHGNTKPENRPQLDQAMGEETLKEQESTSFCEAFDTLVEKELSIDQQMKMAREAGKNRNPNPDHRAIRARQLAKSPKVKDNRTDSEKMADAYASPRKGPGGAVRAD